MERLQLRLLGGFEARTASGRAIGLGGRKAEALLAYLALEPGKRHGREKLANLLWSGLGDEKARNSLRKALTALRKALAEVKPEPLAADRDTVALDAAAVDVDAVEFRKLMADGAPERLERAAALYRGEILEGFSLREPVFEEWLAVERRHFFELVLQALSQRLGQQLGAGENVKGLATAQRLLALDPLHESAHRALMRLYALEGEREAALRQYQSLRDLLERELGIAPEAETDALVDAIRNGDMAGAPPDRAAEAKAAEAEARRPPPAPLSWWRAASLAAAALLVLAVGLTTWYRPWEPRVESASESAMALPLPDKPSIAVIPFLNLGDDQQQNYFTDGLTEDLITALARIDGLFVISRNSTFTYKGEAVKVKQVAEDLGVRYVLEGSVRRSGEQIRINAQLVDALTGFHLWAERFDGSLRDIFEFQDHILQQITAALAVNLSPEKQPLHPQMETEIPQAYDALLRGWQYARVMNAGDHAKAISHLQKAIELDPSYSRAYAALAHVYWLTFAVGWQRSLGLTQKEVMDLTTRYLHHALENPTPLAHVVALHVHYIRGKYDEGFAAAEKAIAAGVTDPDGYDAMTKAYLYTGHPYEALEVLEQGARLDPLNPESYIWRRGQVLYHLGRYQASAEQLRLALEIGVDFTDTHMYLAAAYGRLGKAAEAKSEIEQIKIKEKDEGWSYSVLSVDSWSFSSEEIREQFREGLRKAGLDEIPWSYDVNSPDMVRGEDIRSLYFGRRIKGTDAQSGEERIISITEDGEATSRIGELVDTGLVDGWHDEKLCIRWEGEGRVCVVTFRNPEGTRDRFNEYDYVYFGGVIPFSPVD